jgi:hypothetical protein
VDSMARVRKGTTTTEQPLLVGEISANVIYVLKFTLLYLDL